MCDTIQFILCVFRKFRKEEVPLSLLESQQSGGASPLSSLHHHPCEETTQSRSEVDSPCASPAQAPHQGQPATETALLLPNQGTARTPTNNLQQPSHQSSVVIGFNIPIKRRSIPFLSILLSISYYRNVNKILREKVKCIQLQSKIKQETLSFPTIFSFLYLFTFLLFSL